MLFYIAPTTMYHPLGIFFANDCYVQATAILISASKRQQRGTTLWGTSRLMPIMGRWETGNISMRPNGVQNINTNRLS